MKTNLRQWALVLALCSSLCGCTQSDAPKPAISRGDVSGEILSVQEDMGWSMPIHTVIRDEQGYVVRVYGAYGQRGDRVKLRNVQLLQ